MSITSSLEVFDDAEADVFSSDLDLDFLSEPFFPSPEPYLDFLQLISSSSSSDPSPPLPSSPPSQQLGSLSIEPGGRKTDGLDTPSVKLEASSVLSQGQNSDGGDGSGSVVPDGQSMLGLKQRSFSSQCLDRRPCFLFQPHLSSLAEVQDWDPAGDQAAPYGALLMRRSCSTGDLLSRNSTQRLEGTRGEEGEEGVFKVGRYSAEERRQRIHKYRCKRNQRNFNKTIKYACRKTLADSRPRVRGRFCQERRDG